MTILFWIFLFSIIIFLIIFFIIKSITKAVFIVFIVFFIISLIVAAVVISDAKSLSQLQKSNSLFVYEKDEDYKSAISIDFLESKPTSFTKEELLLLKEEVTSDQTDISDEYFKIFTFSDQSLDNLLSDNISISEGVEFSKEEITQSLNSESQEDVDSAFTLSILNILNNLQDKDKLSIFLNEHREKRITISPQIKAISLLSTFPKSFVDSVLSRI
ncbi:hypothetical protein HOF78_00225 [Candidatus Woesearchaeota archaeon]|jgi:hypothetical protein|nr:hypothetical protein [Candidatus Woesearchaeota archaeon]MBT6044608.1 hypothetical protein [Candidatus Woesearchaeota archaeon]